MPNNNCVWVPGNRMSHERLDTGYYSKEYFEAYLTLEKSELDTAFIGDISEPWCFGAYSLCNEIMWATGTEGIPYIKAEALGSPLINFEGLSYITRETHELLSKSKLHPGDIIISTSGTIGKCAVIPSYLSEVNSNQDTMKFSLKNKDFDNYFIVTWIASKYGQILLKREAGGAIQQHIYLNNFRKLLLVKPLTSVQKYIGDKVRQAERLRDRSREADLELRNKMQECFLGKPKPLQNKFSTVSTDTLTDNRLESEFYTPLVLWADEEIKGTPWSYQPLSKLTDRIKDGPGGWGVSTNDYVNYGIPVIRATNLIDGECDLLDCIFISPKKHQDLISHEAKKGSIVLSVRGTIGRAAVFESEDYEKASLNAAVVTIDCKKDILPHYLAEFLNTEIGKIQSNRIANGAVQLNMNLRETGSNLIVIAPMNFQEEVSSLRQQRLLLKALTQKLTTAAKLLVEALIEGNLSEADLKAAQEGLERGDTTLDREILDRLTRKGIDNPNEPPLFPDLDALYTALASLDETTEAVAPRNSQTAKVYDFQTPYLALASEDRATYQVVAEVPE
ncbi:restriction endonuclease subunit S [Chamaesiphon sp.]|uniref:restriction endonuclease subunit S n=1 Tax=Chamaesiphon sp. TaxID=2814140 RepID=UPI00359352D7